MWILPTYNRPEKFAQFVEAARRAGTSTRGVVVLNGSAAGYDFSDLPEGWEVMEVAPEGMVKAVNAAFDRFPSEPWYGIVVDDSVPITHGWDEKIVARAMQTGIASCNDLDQAPKRMCGAVVYRGDIVRAAGFIYPRCTWHAYGDDWWEQVGRDYACWSVLMDVVVEHKHPFKLPALMDATHERSYAKMAEDKVAYEGWVRSPEGVAAVQGIAKVLGIRMRDVDLTGKVIAFGTPAYGGKFDAPYIKGMAYTGAMLERQKLDFFTIFVTNDSLIHKARNSIIKSFLEDTTATHLMFIDADMGWEPDSVVRLLSHGKEVVGAAGIRKEDPISFCYRPHESRQICNETGCWRVEAIGTGFLMIARTAIEKMIAAYPQLKYVDAKGNEFHALFYNELADGRDWSEDYTFCKRWGAIGGEIWMDPVIALDHVGNKTWSGSVTRESMIVRN